MINAIRAGITSIFLTVCATGLTGCLETSPGAAWPPTLGKPFPNLVFTSHDGRKVRISDFKGKVVLVEPVGMSCQACNAFSGGHEVGGIGDIAPQEGLGTLEEYLSTYGDGVSLENDDVVLVQILLYDLDMKALDIEDARKWVEHFGLDRNPNVYVVFSEKNLTNRASFLMVPGVQLVDKTSVVRFDSTGHRPRHNLYTQLLPGVRRYLND